MYTDELKRHAFKILKEYWVQAVIVTFVVWLLTDAYTQQNFVDITQHGGQIERFNTANLLSLLVTGPLSLGVARFYMAIEKKKKDLNFYMIFDSFKDFKRTFLYHVLSSIFIILWSLLLIVPGIIAAIRYSMSYYLLAENPDMEAMEALRKSSDLMNGHKWEFFKFCLSFIGWAILCLLTMGIGFLVLIPYFQMSKLYFYRSITSTKKRGGKRNGKTYYLDDRE
ncbi:Uncharacterized membrane protein [Dethiosulfatibacter aminovorans DSM 17477]|uniref:Uncharacterized membrane protein n=1 Tax=Dethiosulfatibacter aminovorans DSM 17477 TaxID=1121476 RepID=A0A1M6LPE2_9FIRM|nr:DUF975 family protein [Dethiosulfatibacter aminovorans]SHJ73071.1 Uncharacterized membrane protein [Dethiosulfatibacter aminovorans DSM 17477]